MQGMCLLGIVYFIYVITCMAGEVPSIFATYDYPSLTLNVRGPS